MGSPYSITDVKTLFALSGNTCAICEAKLTDPSWQQVNTRICHIRGRKPGAPRYDPTQSDEERNGFYNLLLLCPGCSHLIDYLEPDAYTVERLEEIKQLHEQRATDKHWHPTEEEQNRFAVLAIAQALALDAEEDRNSGAQVGVVAQPPDPIAEPIPVNDMEYHDNVRLWVRVTNNGPVAEFAAQVTNTKGFPESWVDYTKPIAWEQTREPSLQLARGAHALLRLGNVSRKPLCVWFYGPASMHTENFHTTWQQNRQASGSIEFDLEVSNLTTSQVVKKRGVVVFGAEGELPGFTLESLA